MKTISLVIAILFLAISFCSASSPIYKQASTNQNKFPKPEKKKTNIKIPKLAVIREEDSRLKQFL